jgi:hypothetical protein
MHSNLSTFRETGDGSCSRAERTLHTTINFICVKKLAGRLASTADACAYFISMKLD